MSDDEGPMPETAPQIPLPPRPVAAARPAAARGSWRFVPWAALLFLAAAVPLIMSGLARGRGQFDQQFFHEPTIRTFAGQWPRPDLRDYLSATTPGYHLAMSLVARLVSDPLVVLKLVSAGFTVGLLWVLEGAVRRRMVNCGALGVEACDRSGRGGVREGVRATVLLAPLVCSMYVLMPGVWLQPDNAGWLGVLVVVLIGLGAARGRWDWMAAGAGGVAMLLLVWTRQNHVWAAGVLWVGAWVGAECATERGSGRAGSQDGERAIWRVTGRRAVWVGMALVATLPALLSLAWFWKMWGGLTPPEFQKQHAAGFNAATPAFALALLGIHSCFFGAWTIEGLRLLARDARGRIALAACVIGGVVLAAVPETTFVYEARATGLWNVVRALDARGLVLAGRTSPLMLALAPLGAVMLAAWLVQLPRREAWVLGAALVGFTCAQTANTNAWQRYLEPMLLVVIALMAARIVTRPKWDWAAWLGPLALAGLGAALTAYTLWSEPVVVKTW